MQEWLNQNITVNKTKVEEIYFCDWCVCSNCMMGLETCAFWILL